VDDLKRMTDAQDAQIEAAKNGTVAMQQLEKSYTEIEAAAKALVGQNSLIKLFQAQGSAISELEARLAAARKAQQDYQATAARGAQGMSYNEFKSKNLADFTKAEGSHAAAMARISTEWTAYKASLDAGSESQAKSAAEAKKLAQAVAATEKELARAQGRIETTKAKMSEFGIDTADVAAAQQKIVAAVNTANAALERQEQAINMNDAHAAQRKAAADAIAQREQQIKVDNQFAAAERDVAAALMAERRAQQEANEAAAMNRAQQQAEVDILFSNAQRQAAEELNKKTAAINAQRLALQQAADQAERMSRGASATARGQGPVSTPNLAGQIRDIQNPADAAVRSVAGLESSIAGLETRVTEIRGPVKNYREALDEATRAQRALLDIAGRVDAYQRQQTALRAAGTDFGRAQAAVRALVAEMRSANAGDDVTSRLARAQSTLQAAAQRLGNVRTEARAMQAALQAAGVDTNNLTSAEQQLVAQANRATAAVNTLNAAYRRHGAAADDAGSRVLSWFGGSNGRTTLSYFQRMRGELLGLATSFVGLNAAIEGGKKTLDAYNNNQAILSRLTIANGGDTRKAADEFKYLEAQADRIGFVFSKISPAYTKFAIAAREAGFTTQQTHFAFEQIAGSAVKARLSTDELEGVMKAFEQMMSKGTIQAEELRGQLGDRLPGAFQIAARAANMTVEQFTKAVSDGKIGSDQVISIARELGKTYGAAQAGTETLLVAQARFENATNRFLSNTAKGGFVQAYQELLNKLTTMLNDGTADKFASALSTALTAVVDVLKFCADNANGLKLAFEALIAVKVVAWLFTLPGLFKTLRNEIMLARAEIAALELWMNRATAANALSAALGAGGLTGVLGRLAPVLRATTALLIGMARAIPQFALAAVAGEAINYAIDKYDENSVDGLAKTIDAGTQAMKEAYAARAAYDAARGTKDEAAMKAEYDRKAKIAQQGQFAVDRAISAARDKSWYQQGYGAMTNDKVKDALARRKESIDNPPVSSGATPDPGDPDNSRQMLATLKKKLDTEDQKNERQSRLARLKAEKGDLAERLEIIKEPFDELRKQYADTIKDTEAKNKAIAMVDASYAKAAAVERQKYANEQAKNGESAAKRAQTLIEQIRTRIDEAQKEIADKEAKQDPTEPFEKRLAAHAAAVGKAYDKMATDIAKLRPLDPKQAAEFDKVLAKIKEQRKAVEDVNFTREEANRLLDEYNKKQGILNNNLAAIKAEEDNGKISHGDALAQANKQVQDLGPGIEAAGNKALEFATKFADKLDPTRFAEIASTIRQGMAKNGTDAQIALNMMNAEQTHLNDLLAAQEREYDAIHLKRQLGFIDANQEVEQINSVTAKYAVSIQTLAQNLLNFISIVKQKGGMTPEQLAPMEAAATRVLQTSQAGIVQAKEWETTLVQSIAQNGVTAFDQMAQSIGKVITGQQGIGEGFRGMMAASAQFFASLLKDIAMAILRMQILKLLQGMGGGIGGAATALLGGHHTGGIAGGQATFSRAVPVSSMAGAIRYHTGGIAGLAPNEVPAVLQRGEEVLTRDDPRHVLNLGKQVGSMASQAAQPQRFVLVDDRAMVPQAMASSEGEKVTLVHLKNNLPTLKQWLR
jgi:tape measure domain-containing protein